MPKLILLLLVFGTFAIAWFLCENPFGKIAVVLLAIAAIASSFFLKWWTFRRFPNISDQEFLRVFNDKFSFSDESVLYERRKIAKLLSIPYQKISPNHSFDELSRCTNYFGSFDVAMGDLEDEMSELYKLAGMEKPSYTPETVGELIYEVINVKESLNRK